MAKFLVQHRRGTTAQWAEKSTIIPREGELVIEIDETNFLHKLKIGDGLHTYAELAYLQAGDEIVTQVLAEAKPRAVTVNLTSDWVKVNDKYSQTISLEGITDSSRLDLQPSADMLAEFKQLGLVFITENNNGTITVYSVGNMPTKSYTMQATIVETIAESNCIVGTPVGAPLAQSDWNQDDNTKSDYIKNRPVLGSMAAKDAVEKSDLADDVCESLGKADAALPSDGGTISGDLAIKGNLVVNGTTTSENHETIIVEDNMVVLNSNRADLSTALSGVAINKDANSTYSMVYDPTDDTVKFGEGSLDTDNEFSFDEGEGLPLAIRSDSSEFTDGHLVQWSTDGNKFVDSGYAYKPPLIVTGSSSAKDVGSTGMENGVYVTIPFLNNNNNLSHTYEAMLDAYESGRDVYIRLSCSDDKFREGSDMPGLANVEARIVRNENGKLVAVGNAYPLSNMGKYVMYRVVININYNKEMNNYIYSLDAYVVTNGQDQ